MPDIIPTGLFIGADKAEITALLAQLKAARSGMAYSGALTGASINGQSIQYAGREMTLAEFAAELQGPLCYFWPDKYSPPPTNASAARTTPYCGSPYGYPTGA